MSAVIKLQFAQQIENRDDVNSLSYVFVKDETHNILDTSINATEKGVRTRG